jgi:hypothetical protein
MVNRRTRCVSVGGGTRGELGIERLAFRALRNGSKRCNLFESLFVLEMVSFAGTE